MKNAQVQQSEDSVRVRMAFCEGGLHPVAVWSPTATRDSNGNPIRSPGKQPVGKNWRQVALADPRKIIRDKLNLNALNAGILTDYLRVVDVDIEDREKAQQIHDIAIETLGLAPCKYRDNSSRISLIYGSGGKKFKKTVIEGENKDEKVEILGEGQQMVIHGYHPSGAKIRLRSEGFTISMDGLPVVLEEQVQTFIDKVRLLLNSKRQACIRSVQSGYVQNVAHMEDIEVEILKKVAQQIPNDESFNSYDKFMKFAYIVASTFQTQPNVGREVFYDWASRWTEGNQKDGEIESLWTSVSSSKTYHVGVGDIIDIAKQYEIDVSEYVYDVVCKGFEFEDAPAIRNTRPTIRVAPGELSYMATQAEEALKMSGTPIFQRGGMLVKPIGFDVPIAGGKTATSALLHQVTESTLLGMLSEVARWEVYSKSSNLWIDADPPLSVIKVYLGMKGSWTLPNVAGIVTTPTLRPDGTVLTDSGYDPLTRLFHMKDHTLNLNELKTRPSRQDAEDALKHLKFLLSKFPFVNNVDLSVALSMLITPVVRGALSAVPMHVVRASTAGTGKSFLVDVASAIATGRQCPVFAAASKSEETEKRLLGLLLAGYRIINIDNCNGELGGDSLCQAVERPSMRIRPLGTSDMCETENQACIFATGNNVWVAGDMVRRTLFSCLDANLERPELRSFPFNPVSMVMENRGLYVSACLNIVRAHMLADKPDILPKIASFDGWSDTVRSSLVWLGCDDPCKSMETARENDAELNTLKEILTLWSEAFGEDGKTCSDVERELNSASAESFTFIDLRAALLREVGERGSINTKRLGKWIGGRERKIVDGLSFSRSGSSNGSIRWTVRRER